mmetsp:Transcript_50670/g.115069  ORF Transcript_50670/g.115069 Transcript_50670/m.115069 type:complete len:237 (-) Transcript_50670:199-909(-)
MWYCVLQVNSWILAITSSSSLKVAKKSSDATLYASVRSTAVTVSTPLAHTLSTQSVLTIPLAPTSRRRTPPPSCSSWASTASAKLEPKLMFLRRARGLKLVVPSSWPSMTMKHSITSSPSRHTTSPRMRGTARSRGRILGQYTELICLNIITSLNIPDSTRYSETSALMEGERSMRIALSSMASALRARKYRLTRRPRSCGRSILTMYEATASSFSRACLAFESSIVTIDVSDDTM